MSPGERLFPVNSGNCNRCRGGPLWGEKGGGQKTANFSDFHGKSDDQQLELWIFGPYVQTTPFCCSDSRCGHPVSPSLLMRTTVALMFFGSAKLCNKCCWWDQVRPHQQHMLQHVCKRITQVVQQVLVILGLLLWSFASMGSNPQPSQDLLGER